MRDQWRRLHPTLTTSLLTSPGPVELRYEHAVMANPRKQPHFGSSAVQQFHTADVLIPLLRQVGDKVSLCNFHIKLETEDLELDPTWPAPDPFKVLLDPDPLDQIGAFLKCGNQRVCQTQVTVMHGLSHRITLTSGSEVCYSHSRHYTVPELSSCVRCSLM